MQDVKQERLQNRIGPEIAEFRQQQQTLQLASITPAGLPHVSYSPFVFQPDGYYILISDVAQHGQNLKTNPNVSIMMIEDEQDARSIYARKRLSFETQAHLVDRESRQWQQSVDALTTKFGDIVENLSQLNDFNLYQLIPTQGRFVKGFGKAFAVSGEDLVDFVHLDQGHESSKQKIA